MGMVGSILGVVAGLGFLVGKIVDVATRDDQTGSVNHNYNALLEQGFLFGCNRAEPARYRGLEVLEGQLLDWYYQGNNITQGFDSGHPVVCTQDNICASWGGLEDTDPETPNMGNVATTLLLVRYLIKAGCVSGGYVKWSGYPIVEGLRLAPDIAEGTFRVRRQDDTDLLAPCSCKTPMQISFGELTEEYPRAACMCHNFGDNSGESPMLGSFPFEFNADNHPNAPIEPPPPCRSATLDDVQDQYAERAPMAAASEELDMFFQGVPEFKVGDTICRDHADELYADVADTLPYQYDGQGTLADRSWIESGNIYDDLLGDLKPDGFTRTSLRELLSILENSKES